MVTIATLNRKNKKCWLKKVFKVVKDSLETGFARENFSECLGEFISSKSVLKPAERWN